MFKQAVSTLVAMTLNVAPVTMVQSQSLDTVIPSGTVIPVMSETAEKVLVLPTETLAVTLKVAENVRNKRGRVIIPADTEVIGQIEPYRDGSRFVAESLVFENGRQEDLEATSEVVTRTEEITKGTNGRAIVQGAVVGAAAATVLAAVTGDTAIATEEVLGGAGFGALAGWIFGPKPSQELISINPNQDLDITVSSDLYLPSNF
ncbi:hypothetical protein [Gloeocapsa sp. PCC 73106]|uniref:hypothetical protein n=1 Tax=Gloeocapsa sp. PCC 73106 TaxID=102232 RepID=UPI0002AC74E3|nr:hypothetical protein [Gloeocapsa sp. PCC 73106]ELR99709.1 hypothetical protein GLO73106DRAFT_00035610 [Gloeocapsa sp. PCC 73106]